MPICMDRMMINSCSKKINLFLILILSAFITACTSTHVETDQINCEQQFKAFPPLAACFKQKIQNNKPQNSAFASQYQIYTEALIGQIKNKKITEDKARLLLIRKYNELQMQFPTPNKIESSKSFYSTPVQYKATPGYIGGTEEPERPPPY